MRINSLRKITNCLLFLILISMSFNVKAQSTQMSVKSTGVNNSILTLNNISKENLIGFGADLFFPKDALAVTPNYISSIMNSSNVGIYKISGTSTKKEDCPNKEKLIDICDSISLRVVEKEKKDLYYYEYERKILEASCVDQLKDSEDVISNKVKLLWEKHEDLLVCTNANFDVTRGNVLKLAVYRRLDSLLEDAVLVWKINLNRIDPSDNLTVLDYVQKQINGYKGTENEKGLREYYKLLRDGGAKHVSELKK